MKKTIIALGLILLCVGYFFIARNRNDKIVQDKKESIKVLLEKEKEMLTKNYPQTAVEVMESHDRVMAYQYSNEMEEGLVGEVTTTMRLLYSKELLDLNPQEQQELAMTGEVLNNKTNKVNIIKSEIGQVEYTDKNTKAIITDKHLTTRGDKVRRYQLIQQKGEWKIHWWEDIKPAVVPAQTEGTK